MAFKIPAFSAPFILKKPSLLSKPSRPCESFQPVRLNRLRALPARAQLSGVDGSLPEIETTPAPAQKTFWANVPAPVYSACTFSSEVGHGNFNVLTYCTPLGLGATPKWAVALYVGTLTWTNVKQLGVVRLVVLAEHHAPLVGLFGKTSGRVIDKTTEARDMGFNVVTSEDGVPYLTDSPGYVDLVVDQWVDCGDHELAICSTISSVQSGSDDVEYHSPVLTTGKLREMGILDPA